jgi:ABC-type uncharacterized transport system substrate-binding protein
MLLQAKQYLDETSHLEDNINIQISTARKSFFSEIQSNPKKAKTFNSIQSNASIQIL